MLTGTIRNDIDKLWEKFWTGGITDPLTVIKQISYLIFARMLDMQERALRAGNQNFARIFPETAEGQLLRWKNFRQMSGVALADHLKNNVFPHFQTLSSNKGFGQVGEYMKSATVEIKNESVLVSAIELVDKLPLEQSDVKGDIYEYLLSKLSTAGINGQFRTPRHIIDLIVSLVAPKPNETVCDPACGTAGFLARSVEYILKTHTSPEFLTPDAEGNVIYTRDLLNSTQRDFMTNQMFCGFDFDDTMLSVSSINMLLHGIQGANICYQDTLNKSVNDHYPEQAKDFFDVILANPPFKGSLDEANTNPDVLDKVKTKKTYQALHWEDKQVEIDQQFGDKTQVCFVVDVTDIRENGYDLSLNRYKEIVHEDQEYEAPQVIMARIEALETEIQQGLTSLKSLIS